MDLRFLERKNSIKLLLSLSKNEPQRFKDLKKSVSREATLSVRIRELEDLKLIEATVVKEKKQKFFGYKLTDKGLEATKALQKISQL